MSTEADFWTPDGWRRGPMHEDAQRAQSDEGSLSDALKANGYDHIITFGDTDNFITNVSLNLYKHSPTKQFYVEVWGGDYQLTDFFVDQQFCAAFVVDALPHMVQSYGLRDDQAVVAELKALRKAFAAFVRHEHGTHVIDEDGDETLEERRAAAERWRRRQQLEAERKKAKQAEQESAT